MFMPATRHNPLIKALPRTSQLVDVYGPGGTHHAAVAHHFKR
jgi:hypothetical protein